MVSFGTWSARATVLNTATALNCKCTVCHESDRPVKPLFWVHFTQLLVANSPWHPGFPCSQSFLVWNYSSVHWTGYYRRREETGQGGKASATRMACWKEPCYKAHLQTRPLSLAYTCLHVLLNQELSIQFCIALYLSTGFHKDHRNKTRWETSEGSK